MKTQILQLEAHDDVISTRDKMGWGQVARVVLVWPKRERILVRKLDLLLLQRHALKMGAQLALVTNDPDVRFNARQLAIPVFKNLRQVHRSRWRVGRRPSHSIERRQPRPDFEALRQEIHPLQQAWYNQPLVRRAFHIISIFAALALLSLFIPGGRITLHPQTQIQEIRFNVSAGPTVQTVNVTGDLPARNINVIVEGQDQISTTGSLLVPEKASLGRVEFTNLTDASVAIPAGTVVATVASRDEEPVRYQTTVAATLAPGSSILISVRCLEAGRRGNLPAGEINAIEGPLGLRLSVTNPSATTGGSEQPAAAPTLADAQKLFERLSAALQTTALQELRGTEIGPTNIPIEPSLNLVSILEESYSPPLVEGSFIQPASQLSLRLRLEFEGLVVTHQDLQEVSLRVLDANLPQGYRPLVGTLEVEHLSNPIVDQDSSARWRMLARRKLQADIDVQQVLDLAHGLAPAQAKSLLEQELLVNEVDVQLSPDWWPRLPWLLFRIQVNPLP
jgi:hypothetical protein